MRFSTHLAAMLGFGFASVCLAVPVPNENNSPAPRSINPRDVNQRDLTDLVDLLKDLIANPENYKGGEGGLGHGGDGGGPNGGQGGGSITGGDGAGPGGGQGGGPDGGGAGGKAPDYLGDLLGGGLFDFLSEDSASNSTMEPVDVYSDANGSGQEFDASIGAAGAGNQYAKDDLYECDSS